MAQVVEHLPSKCEALSLNPVLKKKKFCSFTELHPGAGLDQTHLLRALFKKRLLLSI
jgi:hypothetical protein